MINSKFFNLNPTNAKDQADHYIKCANDLLAKSAVQDVPLKDIISYHEKLYQVLTRDNNAFTATEANQYAEEFNKISQAIIAIQADATKIKATDETPLLNKKDAGACKFCICM